MKITIKGHVDTTRAAALDTDIESQLSGMACDTEVEFDCKDLEYISSTGLRIFLKYKKKFPLLSVTNVNIEVYNVFHMTGFDRIMNVTKALREVSIAGCEEIGRGGVGIVYRLNEDTIIKVFQPECSTEVLERERVMAKESFVLGMPTAIPYDMVRVPETNSYGLVFELINAGSMASAIKAHPECVEHYGTIFGTTLREMHEIHVPAGTLPQAKLVHEDALIRIAHYFSAEQVELMSEILGMIPEGDSLLHCDCHPKNLMLNDKEEPLLIDMGEVSIGNPIYDLSHTWSSMHIEDGFEAIIGFPKELAEPFWISTLKAYFQTDDDEEVKRLDEIISAIGMLRSFMWISLADFPEEVTTGVRKLADKLLLPQRERLLNAAKKLDTF